MGQPVVFVDAFTDRPFAGNPAAVCVLERAADEGWMQAVAAEMNLSETAFLLPRAPSEFDLRWFTPLIEVDLCGHATLAGAHVLWESGRLPPSARVVFHTKGGVLAAARAGDWIEMDFPLLAARRVAAPRRGLLSALGVEPVWIGRNDRDYMIEVADEQTVRGMAPDFAKLAKVDVRGVIVTAKAETPGCDFVSRFFAPSVGVPEDPVTGSAHCCLAPFWCERLGRDNLVGYQASRRGGTVRVSVWGDRVNIAGQAVTVLRGTLA